MKANRWRARTRDDLIIEVWEELDCESVGARELSQIQQAVRETLGIGAVPSPASIARTLADEGAVLRHPEVLDFDTDWRRHELISVDELNFSGLVESADSIKKLDELRKKFEQEGDRASLRRVREMALKFKQEAGRMARSKIVALEKRAEAGEIAQWITIWLQEPGIFEDWLSLRQRSPEFIRLTQNLIQPNNLSE